MKLKTLDTTKYKRFFAFGCSFTNYYWDTWADIIGKHIPEYYNYGVMGAGNGCIFNSVAEANARHEFTDDDLIIIMWTGRTREDRYVGDRWVVAGNVHLQLNDFYDKKFIKKFSCDRGYLIRDMAYISTTQKILQNSSCDWDFLSMNNIDITDLTKDNDVTALYKTSISDIVQPDCDTFSDRYTESEFIFVEEYNKIDRHPSPRMYYDYLSEVYQHNLDINIIDSILETSDNLSKYGKKKDIEYNATRVKRL